MRYIVTGGAGFIGSHLTKRLVKDGHEVVVIDNLSSGKLENLFPTYPYHIKLIKTDIRKLGLLVNNIKGNIDGIFHLAALVVTTKSLNEPKLYADVNLGGTVNILELARLKGIKRVIYASSGACYGYPEHLPVTEDNSVNPIHPYGLTKYLGEQYVLNTAKFYDIGAIALRLFYVYGSNTRSNSVLSIFKNLAEQDLPLTIAGNGKQSNDYTYVSDVVEAFVLAMKSTITGEVYNVGTGKSSTIGEVASLIGKKVKYVERTDKEPEVFYADISKIRRELGWKPKVSLTEGIKNII